MKRDAAWVQCGVCPQRDPHMLAALTTTREEERLAFDDGCKRKLAGAQRKLAVLCHRGIAHIASGIYRASTTATCGAPCERAESQANRVKKNASLHSESMTA